MTLLCIKEVDVLNKYILHKSKNDNKLEVRIYRIDIKAKISNYLTTNFEITIIYLKSTN